MMQLSAWELSFVEILHIMILVCNESAKGSAQVELANRDPGLIRE